MYKRPSVMQFFLSYYSINSFLCLALILYYEVFFYYRSCSPCKQLRGFMLTAEVLKFGYVLQCCLVSFLCENLFL